MKRLLNLIKFNQKKYFKLIEGLPFDLKIKVSNSFEKRHYEKNEGEFLLKFIEYCSKNTVVYDIGAHIGIFSLCAALSGESIKHVFAFEPTPWNYNTLKENINFNKLQKIIRPFQLALGSKNTEDLIKGVPKSGWGGSSFIRDEEENEIKVNVKIRRGDDLIRLERLPEPSIIKIDVEGFEFEVLKGFENTITKSTPILFIEYHPEYLVKIGLNEAYVHNYLQQLGYKQVFRQKWLYGEQYQCIYL